MPTLLEVAIDTVRIAGKAIMELYETADFETKADGSPITIADTRSNEIILHKLQTTHIPVLSEEIEGLTPPYPSQLWIIDPLDGTRDFIQKNGDFVVMIGLLTDGRPTLGAIYAPVTDTVYYATEGNGAYRKHAGHTTRLHVAPSNDPLRYIKSRNHFSPKMQQLADALGATLVPKGSLGLKAALLVDGDGDFFASHGKFGEWDVCAAEIIVREAGGTVTDTQNKPLTYGSENNRLEHGIIFSNGACHTQVYAALTSIAQEEASV